MLGLLINELEHKEIQYLIKRELEEILLDLNDPRIDNQVKMAMKERYQTLFKIFQRVANKNDCLKYMLHSNQKKG